MTNIESGIPDLRYAIENKTIRYIGEGNCNIVISLMEFGLVLRLRKIKTSLDENEKEAILTCEFDLSSLECEFYNRIMKPLIGNRFVHPITVVRFEESIIDQLFDLIKNERPLFRQHKRIFCNIGMLTVDSTSDKIIDFISGSSLCVEIKCKQGWMSPMFKKNGKCTFCTNQYTKLKKGNIESISGYCPLDLFSGNKIRMEKAIKELMANSQNNLKLFLSGKLYKINSNVVEDYFKFYNIESNNAIQTLINILIKALLWSDLNNNKTSDDDLSISDTQREFLNGCDDSKDLPENCILDKILKIQYLEKDNIQTIAQDSDYDYAKNMIDTFANSSSTVTTKDAILEKATLLQKYMLACIAKDCSIMITIKPLQKENKVVPSDEIVIDDNGINFIVKIAVIDLDPKPTSKIKYHRKRDEDAINNFLNTLKIVQQ